MSWRLRYGKRLCMAKALVGHIVSAESVIYQALRMKLCSGANYCKSQKFCFKGQTEISDQSSSLCRALNNLHSQCLPSCIQAYGFLTTNARNAYSAKVQVERDTSCPIWTKKQVIFDLQLYLVQNETSGPS